MRDANNPRAVCESVLQRKGGHWHDALGDAVDDAVGHIVASANSVRVT